MMDKLWVVLLVALTGAHFGQGLPLRSTPHSYPHNTNEPTLAGWTEGNLYAAVPALALIVTAVGLLFGCTWCYRHKDCKQNEGADNQLFTASATHLHERRSHPPDSGFSEPANNNISEDNNNGPISLREMQNIANNNAAAYIVSENEERNRASRESVVEFEPLPMGIRVADPLERCVDWFGDEDFPRSRLQYLREIGRGWFGRVVEGEIEDEGTTTTVAVKILNQNASLEDKARFLDEARLYRDASHENVLAFVASCLQEDPWILIFELCSTDLYTYLAANRPKMAALNESGVPLRLVCDVTSALSYLHSRGETYGELSTRNVMVRGTEDAARAVLGHYGLDPQPDDNSPQHTRAGDVAALGTLLRDVCSWGAAPPLPDCPYREHLNQVMQLCWNANPNERPTSAQVHALLEHLYLSQLRTNGDGPQASASDFEERWQRLKPNTIPKVDEHVAIVHAPSTSMASHFTGSEEFDVPTVRDSLSVDMDTAVSRSSSIMSDKDPLSIQIKSESMTNLHGSLEDVRNIYLTHNEQAVLECHQANPIEDKEDHSDASVDPWLKDIIAGSQDDVSYYKDVSDVIKNLDNILNSEKTSSSESSHQASPSRDNLSLDCKKDYPMQSSMVKSPGITNFQNILEAGFEDKSPEKKQDEEEDRDTIGSLSHSFERHSDTTSQQTLENLTPDTPTRDMELPCDDRINAEMQNKLHTVEQCEDFRVDAVLPKENKIDNSNSVVTDLCIAPMHSVNEVKNVYVNEDCQTPSDSNLTDIVSDKETVEAKSISKVKDNPVCESVEEVITKTVQSLEQNVPVNVQNKEILPVFPEIVENNEIADLLPNAPLEDNLAIVSRPETTSTNSQKDIYNDLMKPAESTTDSKITPVDMVALEIKIPAPETEQLDSVSHATYERPPRIEETKQGDSLIPTFNIKEESQPESVQSEPFRATHAMSGTFAENHIKNNIETVPVSITETNVAVSKSPEENHAGSLEKQLVNTNIPSNVTTPTLVLSEVQDDIQISTNIGKVPDEFIGKIIKEAETAALHSIESAHTKVSVPEPFMNAETDVMNIFLENEIKASERSTVNKNADNSEVEHAIKERRPEHVQHNSPIIVLNKEEAKNSNDSCLDNIAKEILLDAIQDVPKAMEKANTVDFFQGVKLKEVSRTAITDLGSSVMKSLELDLEIPVTELIPETRHIDTQPIHEENRDCEIDFKRHAAVALDQQIHVTESLPGQNIKNQPNYEKLLSSATEVRSKDTKTQTVIPQTSLDLESTASADSSQSTFLIKDTVKEESKAAIPENPKEARLDEPVKVVMEPEVNAEVILNTFRDSDREVAESLSFKDTQKPEEPSPNKENRLSNVTEEIIPKVNIYKQHALPRSENKKNIDVLKSNDSTAYMNFTDGVQSEILEQDPMAENVKDTINFCLETPGNENCSLVKNESTVYLDLPTVIQDTDNFLHAERQISSQVNAKDPLCSSTPKSVADDVSNSIEEKSDVFSETKVPDYGPGVTLTKLEQQCVPDFLSPFDSPTKSHPTDTYDENSSVVLGPFENCTMELFKGLKSGADLGDIPKEEILAFSSNFSEMNLETPSPLRDGNFLNEVPDIIHDDIQFEDITSEPKDEADPKTDSDPTDQSLTEKKVSPSTPPNSPGYFLASTSQQKYLVDIDLNQPTEPAPIESDSGLSSLHKEIELNQIELQITSKLAMAENENNLNIEYSGPLTVEGLVQNDLLREEESAPEAFLAGNGGNIEDVREMFTLDEDCVNALRNELELKLPLAQVAAIEPACEAEGEPEPESWTGALPPPPELVLSYPGALSPIAEETGLQLSAYENDAPWNASQPTDSSESYPEPCNNSTEEPTELPTGLPSGHDTYSLPGGNHTYTVHGTSSKEITMSADSLNAGPAKTNAIDDRTFTADDKPRSPQVSPVVLSPTTDSSAAADVVTGVSTLSKTTLPTDANVSKPEETQLSKATSIDSWCSNDTLYNVEEAFDDLASDPELPADFDAELDDSESSPTLTVNDEKELSHVSTYIVNDGRSDDDRFSPDSITADDNYTYTKAKNDAVASPSVMTKSEANDSKTQTRDLAYGTMGSGPSYSNCTTEVLSADNGWMFPHPELVRRSPIDRDVEISVLPQPKNKPELESSPRLESEPCIKKMDSVDISCLEDDLLADETSPKHNPERAAVHESPDYHYNMATGVTSTPLTEVPSEESVEPVTMSLAEETRTPENLPNAIPNFHSFLFSAELRPQETPIAVEGNAERTEVVLEGDSPRFGSDITPSFIEFIQAATSKPQETSRLQSSQNGSDDFSRFENSAKFKPQELSAIASNSLLLAEREASSVANYLIGPSQSCEPTSLVLSPPTITNLKESHVGKVNTVIITDLEEDETEQPHSIIIAEISKEKESPNRTFDSHILEMNHTYDSHSSRRQKDGALKECTSDNSRDLTVNGVNDENHDLEKHVEAKSPEVKTEETKLKEQSVNNVDAPKDVPNGSVANLARITNADLKCNGNSENFATVNFINESFEELMESNVDDGDPKDGKPDDEVLKDSEEDKTLPLKDSPVAPVPEMSQDNINGVEEKMAIVTEDFLQNEKKFCQLDSYLPLLSDIRFTGPASEIMSTSFAGDSPTDGACDKDDVKEWDSDSDSRSTNSSSGEFIWKGGDGQETSVVPTTQFDHRGSNGSGGAGRTAGSSGSGSGSGSEGDEVEFVPSSWDCRAEPAKSSLRSLRHVSQDNKKRVVFKRQKYHCVYEYPRELAVDVDSPAYLPDLSTYTEWDPTSAEEAELGYGQLFGAPSPLDLFPRAGIAFGADYDEDFFISSSARPFESLGVMSTSQFFPGMQLKPLVDHFPPPPSPLAAHVPSPAAVTPLPPAAAAAPALTRAPSLDLTTPDSGVEDITPGSTSTEEDFKTKKLPEAELGQWRSIDSGSSSESVSPSSPGGEALGGLRHTRDKLKLDLPPSPHVPSPRHSRVFNFVLDKPKRRSTEDRPEVGSTPLVMSDDTPVGTGSLPVSARDDAPGPEPTFSTFGKNVPRADPEQKIILTDDPEPERPPSPVKEPRGEGTVLDSGDEDSGIESSSKATLERKQTPTSLK